MYLALMFLVGEIIGSDCFREQCTSGDNLSPGKNLLNNER